MRPVVEAQSEKVVRGFVEDADCLPNGFGWFQLNGYGSFHEQIAGHVVYMGFCGTMVKVDRGARDHLSHCLVSEVPQRAPPMESPVGIVRALKGISARVLFDEHPSLRTMFRQG
jgi:hypothetical protein